MEKSKKQEFSSRVAEANRTELIVIMYEIILENINESIEAIQRDERDALAEEIKQARGILNHLMGSLDYQYSLSLVLMRLYIYLDKLLSGVLGNRKMEELKEVEEIVRKLCDDFREIGKQDYSEPIMRNTESIYAGLTYGKQSLNETVNYGGQKRGFTV